MAMKSIVAGLAILSSFAALAQPGAESRPIVQGAQAPASNPAALYPPGAVVQELPDEPPPPPTKEELLRLEVERQLSQARGARSRKDFGNALSYYVRVLALRPENIEALSGAGMSALAIGDERAAQGFLARAVTLNPQDGQARLGLARALTGNEAPQDALRQFSAAERLGVPLGDFVSDRGMAHDLAGETREALRDHAMALSLHPGDPEVIRRYALSQAIARDRQGALRTIQPLVARGNDAATRRTVGFIHALTGDVATATQMVRETMPGKAGAFAPYFAQFPALNPVQRARAVYYGELPPLLVAEARPRKVPDRVRLPDSDPVAVRSRELGDTPPVLDEPRPAPKPVELARRGDETPDEMEERVSRELAGDVPAGRRLRSGKADVPPKREVAKAEETKASEPDLSACEELTGRRKTQCELSERALARRCSVTPRPRTAECVALAKRADAPAKPAKGKPEPEPKSAAKPAKGDAKGEAKTEVAAGAQCDGMPDAKRRQCERDERALAKRCGGASPPKTAECRAFAARDDSAPAKGGPPKPGPKDAAKPGKDAAKPATSKKPERVWVQVAGGERASDMPKEWKKLQDKYGKALKGRSAWFTPGRLLVGPLADKAAQRALVNQLSAAGLSTIPYTSKEGAEVTPLAGR